MGIATVLETECHRLGLTHEGIARITHYSRQSVTAWANGRRRLPRDAGEKLAAISPRLALELAAADPANIWLTGWLDGDVDLSVLATLAKLAEELDEASGSLKALRLVNKVRAEHLTTEDVTRLDAAEQELLDLMTGIPVCLVKISEVYGRNLHQGIRQHRRKLVERHYKSAA